MEFCIPHITSGLNDHINSLVNTLVEDLADTMMPLERCPALVLNADFRPLSYYPLSVWPWQEAVKAIFC